MRKLIIIWQQPYAITLVKMIKLENSPLSDHLQTMPDKNLPLNQCGVWHKKSSQLHYSLNKEPNPHKIHPELVALLKSLHFSNTQKTQNVTINAAENKAVSKSDEATCIKALGNLHNSYTRVTGACTSFTGCDHQRPQRDLQPMNAWVQTLDSSKECDL